MYQALFATFLQDATVAIPYIGWAALAILVLCFQILTRSPRVCLIVTLVGLAALMGYDISIFSASAKQDLFNGTVAFDSIGQIFNLIGMGTVLGVVLTLVPGLRNPGTIFQTSYEQLPELLVCLLISGFGLSVLVSAIDLSSLFLGLETLSIGLYCVCGFYRTEIRSTESAFKYLIIGAFSTVVFLYGLAFLYGATGATHYGKIFLAIQSGVNPALLNVGIIFILAAFGFKMAFVPFHLYTADVYEGAPSPITGYIATIVKLGMLGAGLRIFWGLLSPVVHLWEPLWISLCILSIFVGNIGALQQRTLKKMLAFSSIAHAGFMGFGLVVARSDGGSVFPLISYLLVYTAMTLGVFAVITYTENRARGFLVEDLRGLGSRRFGLSLLLSIYILSLAGLPPFAGFMIKFWILQALVEQGLTVVAILAVVGSLIGAAYYLKLLMYMFMSQEKGAASEWKPLQDRFFALRVVVVITLLVTLFGGLRPQFYADWISSAIAMK